MHKMKKYLSIKSNGGLGLKLGGGAWAQHVVALGSISSMWVGRDKDSELRVV